MLLKDPRDYICFNLMNFPLFLLKDNCVCRDTLDSKAVGIRLGNPCVDKTEVYLFQNKRAFEYRLPTARCRIIVRLPWITDCSVGQGVKYCGQGTIGII